MEPIWHHEKLYNKQYIKKIESTKHLIEILSTHTMYVILLKKKVFSAITGFFFFQPLKVEVDPSLVERIDEILNSKSSEKDDVLRTVFNGARNYVQAEISNSLQEFRSKLCLGTKVKCQIDFIWVTIYCVVDIGIINSSSSSLCFLKRFSVDM